MQGYGILFVYRTLIRDIYIYIVYKFWVCSCPNIMGLSPWSQDQQKIQIDRSELKTYWTHVANHFVAGHPACKEGMVHIPIGLSGDDAKYTLAGAKVVVMMLSYVLQEVHSNLDYM